MCSGERLGTTQIHAAALHLAPRRGDDRTWASTGGEARVTRAAGEKSCTRKNGSPLRRLHLWVAREPQPRIGIVYGSPVRDVSPVLQ
jgi:hypothetical protein